VVASPEDVPEDERMTPELGQQFIIHQLGSDRLSRVQNGGGLLPIYSQIRSTLWYDGPVDESGKALNEDGLFKLRHDSFYDDDKFQVPGSDHGLVTEIHFQTEEQRTNNITGPMVSLLHATLGLGKNLGGCTCVADPVGVPVLGGLLNVNGGLHASFGEGATYLGRIKMALEYDGFKLGDEGHGDMTAKRNVTVDHYSKWFLHLFIDADPESPTYNQPLRFYGPYSGFAVYVAKNDTVPPSEVWDTACVDNGWGTPEEHTGLLGCNKPLSHYDCMNVEKTHPEVCAPYEKSNSTVAGALTKGAFGSFWVPNEMPEVHV